ncbi:MAG: hypothetical protein ACI4KM_09320 [Oscillospiraceae bacterium]
MKKRVIIIAACAIAVIAAAVLILQLPQKVNIAAEAAAYLSEKYGESWQAADCVYSREGYTDSQRDILGNGSTTVYSDLAVFMRGDKQISVQRSEGGFCDDGQNADFGYMLAEHFSEKCGVEITFAELRSCSNGSIPDGTITNVLRSNNSLLNKDNIEDILLNFADTQPHLELALYLPDNYPDRRALNDKLAAGLSEITANEGFSCVRYFLYSADEELIVNSTLGASRDKENGSYEYYALNFPYYYAANPYLHFVLDIEGTVYYNLPKNTFTAAGWCIMDRGYSAGLGSRPYEEWNGWDIYTLAAE